MRGRGGGEPSTLSFSLKKKDLETSLFIETFFPGVIFLWRAEMPFPLIVMNLTWTQKELISSHKETYTQLQTHILPVTFI